MFKKKERIEFEIENQQFISYQYNMKIIIGIFLVLDRVLMYSLKTKQKNIIPHVSLIIYYGTADV